MILFKICQTSNVVEYELKVEKTFPDRFWKAEGPYFKKITFAAIPDLITLRLSNEDKYEILDEISIDINIPEIKVIRKITSMFTEKNSI